MCESHVSGNQFAASKDLKAQTVPSHVSPARTWLFSVTYSGSSKLTNSKRRTWLYTASVTTTSSTPIHISRCHHGAAGGGGVSVLVFGFSKSIPFFSRWGGAHSGPQPPSPGSAGCVAPPTQKM